MLINYFKANRDRRVHIADKRHEWVKEFREHISEVLTIAAEINVSRETENFDEANLGMIELRSKINLTRLMLDKYVLNSEQLLENLGSLLVHSFGQDISSDFLALDEQVYREAHRIINQEWERIEKLSY